MSGASSSTPRSRRRIRSCRRSRTYSGPLPSPRRGARGNGGPRAAGPVPDLALPEPLTVRVDGTHSVSALLRLPARASACYVLAHGAGAGMAHPFLEAVAEGLADRNIATLRYQFPFMEAGGRRPDPPQLAHATVRAAVAEASRAAPGARAHRRRAILRRPHDLAGAGGVAP